MHQQQLAMTTTPPDADFWTTIVLDTHFVDLG